LEEGAEAVEFGAVEGEFGVRPPSVEGGLFRAGEFAGDEVGELGEVEFGVEGEEVGFDDAGAHEVDAGEEDAVDVEEGFDAAGGFLFEELPLGLGEAEVVVGVVAGDAGLGDVL
jgi:hypothetical protein